MPGTDKKTIALLHAKFTLHLRQALDAAGVPRFKIFRDAVINLVSKLDREPVVVKDVFKADNDLTDAKLEAMAGAVAHRCSRRGEEVHPVAVFGDPQITGAAPRDGGMEIEFTTWLAFGMPSDEADDDDRAHRPI